MLSVGAFAFDIRFRVVQVDPALLAGATGGLRPERIRDVFAHRRIAVADAASRAG